MQRFYFVAKPPIFPKSQFPCLLDLCKAALRNFSRASLNSAGPGLGTAGKVMEAQYHDEFYRACYVLLGNHVYLTSEWSGSSSGRVDFQIKPVRWAIECVRDGDRIEEHIARFRPGGRYHK